MSQLKLFLFGPPRVELEGTPVDNQRRKALALLVYLAVTGQPHSRDALATLFWPDHSQQRARAYFRRDLAVLNTSLAGNWLLADRETVELNREAGLWLDTAQFERLLATCQSHPHPPASVCPDCLPLLTEAVALYTGDFLAGFTLRDSPEFDDWQFFQAETLRQQLASALERLVQGLSGQAAYETALPHARRWVVLDPLYEPAQQALMRLYDQTGQIAAALRQYEEYVKLLDEELGLPPEEETVTLYEAIKAKRLLKPFLQARQETPPVKVPPPASAAAPASGPLPAKLGRYELLEKIGQGGFATVYRGWDSELDRLVALKALHAHLLADTRWVKRFWREAKLIARLDHPHIVTIYDVGQAQGRHFIVMRLVQGPNLAERLAERGRLAWAGALEMIKAVAQGLDYAHSLGILHRDLKPANILLDSERGPLLSDFGLAKLLSENSLSRSGDIIGTPYYIAPEVWEGQAGTPQTDIYALGCIFYELVVGQKLFNGETPPTVMAAHFQPPGFPSQWPEGVSAELTTVLAQALARHPQERFATAGAMVAALERLSAGPGIAAEAQSPDLSTPVQRVMPRHNLPAQGSPFIGREGELSQIRQLLLEEPDCRLLTLVGPGGTGKTRLALAAATTVLEAFPHGVHFVPLAPVEEPELIVSAIAEALNFSFAGAAEPKEQLLIYLREKNLLLVLDNFEHLLAGAELLSEMLHAAPRVTLLATSRERLNLQEEWSSEVGGMTFPQPGETIQGDDSAALEPYSALRLFVQRARQANASFSLSTADIPAAVRICELVDGMPLGLELAAPWVRLMTCREIALELERNVDLLSTSLRNVPERHRSVRAIFEQTWERLLPEEQAVLSKLAVFRGGCLRPAAEAVTGATLPRLLSLVDKALLRRSRSGRYEMHELIRQFSLEQLQGEIGTYEQVQNEHYAYYTAFLQQQTGALKGGRQKEALEAITADIDNVRAAWHRALEGHDAPALEAAAEGFGLYCEMRGALHEGEAAFQQAAAAFTSPAGLKGFLLAGQGMLRAQRGELAEGQTLLEEGLALLRQGEADPRPLAKEAFALMWLGWTLFLQGKNAAAEQIVQESLALFAQVGERWGIAKNLFVVGNSLTARGQLAASEPPLRESLAICRELQDRRSWLLVNRNLAILTFWFGDYAQTRALLDHAALLSGEFDDQIGLAYTLREMGKLEMAEGEVEQAIQTLQKSIAITDEIGSQWESAATHDDLGVALGLTGDFVAAEWTLKQCLAAAQALDNRYYTARCWGDLGWLAYQQADYSQAQQHLEQALALWAEIGHEPYRAWVLSQLGHVAAAEKNGQSAASAYYRAALPLTIQHKLAPFALEVFVGAARLLSESGQVVEAAQLLTLAQQHPASTFETRQAARDLLAERQLSQPGEVTAASLPDWQTVAERTIDLLSPQP